MINQKFQKDEWQQAFLDAKGDKILNCGRRVGKTVICGEDAGEYAANTPNVTVLMIAPTERQSKILFRATLDYLLLNYKTSIKKGRQETTTRLITLKNKSTIHCVPTGMTGVGIRGMNVHRLYADEASRIPEEVWVAVTPMLLTTGGDTIMLSTPAGKGTKDNPNYFYDVLTNKDEAFNSFTRFETTSPKVVEERPICDSWTQIQREKAFEKIEQAKARMTNRFFLQEYMAMFTDDIDQYFSDDLIKSCMNARRREPPIRKNKDYYIGVDVAGQGEDENTYEIFERINETLLTQVDNIVEIHNLTTMTTRTIKRLDRQYNFQKIWVDDGGVGFGVWSELKEDEDTRYKTEAINNSKRAIDQDKQKRLRKEELYVNLKWLMENKMIELLDDPEIFQSFKSVQADTLEDGRLVIRATYGHIVEGVMRAAWAMKTKIINTYISYF